MNSDNASLSGKSSVGHAERANLIKGEYLIKVAPLICSANLGTRAPGLRVHHVRSRFFFKLKFNFDFDLNDDLPPSPRLPTKFVSPPSF